MKKIISQILLVACLVLLTGCGGISIPTEDGGTVNFTKDGFTVEGTDGSKGTYSTDKDGGFVIESDDGSELKFGEDLELPEGYPEDILPLYQEESIITTSSADGGFYIMYISGATANDCTEFYKELVEDIEGKTITTSDSGAMIFANISGKECAVMITTESTEEDKASVSLTIGTEQ